MTVGAKLEPGRILAARYTLLRALGTGYAWLARDDQAGRDVVLKFPRDSCDGAEPLSSQEQFDLATTAARAGLVRLFDAGREDGLEFLVMEFLPGGEAGALRGRPWSFIVRRMLPVLDALGALHEAGYVHGDVKSANVLLDADGSPKLVDLGCARRIGSIAPAWGSPFGMSPQRLDGASAAVSDDVYATGAMLYELVSGHPPFYPQATPQKVRDEVPHPLTGRPDPPQGLCDVVARCLAKDPAQRPASMADLERELRTCLESPEEPAPVSAAASGWVPRPPAEPAPIRPVPRRAAGSGPSDSELRSEGFRRGIVTSALVISALAVLFVFFVLPGLVDRGVPQATSAPPKPAPAQDPVRQVAAPADLERLAELKSQAEQLRATLVPRLDTLKRQDVNAWGAAPYAAVVARLTSSDRSAADRNYSAALDELKAMEPALSALERQRAGALRDALRQGRDALTSGRSQDASRSFEAALRIDPGNAEATSGLKRSAVLDQVLGELAVAARKEQDGDLKGAGEAYRRALAIDPDTAVARQGLARVASRIDSDAYSAALAQGFAALSRKDYAAARAQFERAARMRPGAPEVADGLRQVDMAQSTRELSAIIDRAARAERDERWVDALAAYREALKADATLLEAQQGVERAEPRAQLDAELQAFLDRPERLFSQEGRGAASTVLARARQVPLPGSRLTGQISRLEVLVTQAGTPVHVALASDNVTEVQIYRVGKLGVFDRRELDLLPGRYTAVGTRSGYRDVRREFMVLPGTPPPALVIRCEEPI